LIGMSVHRCYVDRMVTVNRFVVVAASFAMGSLLLAGCGSSASPSVSTTASSGQEVTLTQDSLRAVIADTTHTGTDETGQYTEYYGAEGSVKGKDYTGTWVIKSDRACFTYPPEAEQCYSVTRDPSKPESLTWTAQDSSTEVTTFVSGDRTGF
jgi:outer membrane murein-binding lipoprotein Lpp